MKKIYRLLLLPIALIGFSNSLMLADPVVTTDDIKVPTSTQFQINSFRPQAGKKKETPWFKRKAALLAALGISAVCIGGVYYFYRTQDGALIPSSEVTTPHLTGKSGSKVDVPAGVPTPNKPLTVPTKKPTGTLPVVDPKAAAAEETKREEAARLTAKKEADRLAAVAAKKAKDTADAEEAARAAEELRKAQAAKDAQQAKEAKDKERKVAFEAFMEDPESVPPMTRLQFKFRRKKMLKTPEYTRYGKRSAEQHNSMAKIDEQLRSFTDRLADENPHAVTRASLYSKPTSYNRTGLGSFIDHERLLKGAKAREAAARAVIDTASSDESIEHAHAKLQEALEMQAKLQDVIDRKKYVNDAKVAREKAVEKRKSADRARDTATRQTKEWEIKELERALSEVRAGGYRFGSGYPTKEGWDALWEKQETLIRTQIAALKAEGSVSKAELAAQAAEKSAQKAEAHAERLEAITKLASTAEMSLEKRKVRLEEIAEDIGEYKTRLEGLLQAARDMVAAKTTEWNEAGLRSKILFYEHGNGKSQRFGAAAAQQYRVWLDQTQHDSAFKTPEVEEAEKEASKFEANIAQAQKNLTDTMALIEEAKSIDTVGRLDEIETEISSIQNRGYTY